MNRIAVEVDRVGKRFRLYEERNQTLKSAIMRRRRSVHTEFWALRDVSFQVPAGSTFALVGSNGSGKSTLLKCLARIYRPTEGSITHHGRVAAMLELGSGFHPELSGRENIFLNGSILGMPKKEITAKLDEIIEFSGVERFIDQPVKNFSSGMQMRLGFSIAIHVRPDILVVDEVLAVGDLEFQRQCYAKFRELQAIGSTVILVTHALDVVADMCDQAAWIEQGTLREVGDASAVVDAYRGSLEHDTE